jgi:O-antigen/teichoic acid export membrane protein
MSAAPESLVPIIVLLLVGPDATAFYVAAWQIAFTIRLIAVNLGSAVTVEGSVEGASHHRLGRQVRWLAPSAIVPAVALVVLFAPLLMRLFGPDYAAAATDLLRLLVLAVLPFAAVTLFIVGERIAERTAVAFVVVSITAVTTLGLDLLLLPVLGLIGAGWSWLIAQSVGAALAGLVVWRRRSRDRGMGATASLREGTT